MSAWEDSTVELKVRLYSMPVNIIVCCALTSESDVFIAVDTAGGGVVVRTAAKTKTIYRKLWLDDQSRVEALSKQYLYELRQHP